MQNEDFLMSTFGNGITFYKIRKSRKSHVERDNICLDIQSVFVYKNYDDNDDVKKLPVYQVYSSITVFFSQFTV